MRQGIGAHEVSDHPLVARFSFFGFRSEKLQGVIIERQLDLCLVAYIPRQLIQGRHFFRFRQKIRYTGSD